MDTADQRKKRSLVGHAVVFEGSLALLGGVIAWFGSIPLMQLMWPDHVPLALVWGALATVPLLAILAATLWCRWKPIARLRHLVTRMVKQIFGEAPLWQLAAVSLAAGFGEEVLFRGALQPLVAGYTSPTIGLCVVGVLFGLVHAASWTYFCMATGVGFYLGGLTLWREEILSAIVVHALYDFIALWCLMRRWKW